MNNLKEDNSFIKSIGISNNRDNSENAISSTKKINSDNFLNTKNLSTPIELIHQKDSVKNNFNTYNLPLILAPSILAANFGNLIEQTDKVVKGGCQWLHLDIMDGHFVPNISMGPNICSILSKSSSSFLDVHLMVTDPAFWVIPFKIAGAHSLSFHFEALNNDIQKTIDLSETIHNNGMKVGLAIKPNTPIQDIFPAIRQGFFSLILIMTVEPGFGGQAFIPEMMYKVNIARSEFPDIHIQVDGGLNETTTKTSIKYGANVIVAGTSIFKNEDIPKATENMIKIMNESKKEIEFIS